MVTSRRRPFGSNSAPLSREDAIARALDAIGHLSDGAAKDELRKAQGLLYEAQRNRDDLSRIQVAARLIRATGVKLMKVAAGLDAANVTPIRGSRRGGITETMTVEVKVEIAQQ